MTSSNNTSIPPEIVEALSSRPAEERDRIVRVWQLLGYVEEESPIVPDTETALAEFDRALENASMTLRRTAPDRPSRSPQRHRRRWLVGLTTCFLLALASAVLLWRVPVRITATAGQQVEATLPDGSTVELNSGSRIEYARGFESWPWIDSPAREIYLEGEAYFEVQPDTRPFVLESFNAQVRVLGTGFNVRAHPAATFRETVVTLSHGNIQVTAAEDPGLNVTLSRQGESIRVIEIKENVDIERRRYRELDRVLAWRNRGFAADDIPLIEAIEELERRYALSIELDDAISSTDSINIWYTGPSSAEEIVQSICLAVTCNFRQTSDGFVIF